MEPNRDEKLRILEIFCGNLQRPFDTAEFLLPFVTEHPVKSVKSVKVKFSLVVCHLHPRDFTQCVECAGFVLPWRKCVVFSCVCGGSSRSGGGGSRWCPVEQGDWVQASGGAPSRQGPGARVAGWTRNPEETQPWRDPRSQTSVQSPAHSISLDTPWTGSSAKSFLPAQGHGLLTLLIWPLFLPFPLFMKEACFL